MSALPKYEKYKDSGAEWLGEIPEHWGVCRNLGVFDERNERGRPHDELLSVTIRRGVIRQSEITTKKDSSNEDKSKYKVLKEGDLAYNKMRAWQGALGISPYDGIVSPAYIILQPKNSKLSKYFHYLYRTPGFITEANRLSYGLCDDMNSLRYDDFKGSHSPLPPNDEVDRIVTFLDRKTAEIDTLITKKQRQIELLNEQKAILINHAVTRGLDPNAKLKPSGIEWIGEIPEGWEVLKLRRLLDTIEQGSSPNAVQDDGDKNQWKVVTLSAISKGRFRNEAYKPISSATTQKEANTLVGGDLLLTRANTRSLVGDACIVENVLPNITFSDLVYRFSPNSRVTSEYLLLYLLSNAARSQIERDARGSNETMCKVSHGHIKEWVVTLPPESEQLEIVTSLQRFADSLKTTMDSLDAHIETLKTLRSTLIAHAVTGRIKCR